MLALRLVELHRNRDGPHHGENGVVGIFLLDQRGIMRVAVDHNDALAFEHLGRGQRERFAQDRPDRLRAFDPLGKAVNRLDRVDPALAFDERGLKEGVALLRLGRKHLRAAQLGGRHRKGEQAAQQHLARREQAAVDVQALDADVGVQRAAGKAVEHEPLREVRRHRRVRELVLVIGFVQQPEHHAAADGDAVLARLGLLGIRGRLGADEAADVGREIGQRIFQRDLLLARRMADPPREVNGPCGGFHL